MRARVLAALALSAALAACAAPAEETHLTPVAELPESYRQVLEVYGRDGEEWRARRVELLEEPELARFLVENLVREMLRAFDRSRFARADDLEGPFERAQNELVFFQEYSVPVLVELLAIGDGVSTYLTAQTLERIGRPAVKAVTRALEHPDGDARRRAAEVLGRLPHAREGERWVQEALARRLVDDPEWIVRAQCAEALAARAAHDREVDYALGRLIVALDDEDPAVARTAAGGLGQVGDVRAVPALIDYFERTLAGDRPGDVQVARRALVELTGVRDARTPREWRAVWNERKRG